MKKIIICLLVGITTLIISSCVDNGNKKEDKNMFKTYDIKDIVYTNTKQEQKENSEQVIFSLSPIKEYNVGETVYVNIKLASKLTGSNPYYYAIVDFGDGTWSYQGPFESSANNDSNPRIEHIYTSSGVFEVKGACVEMKEGKLFGWSETLEFNIKPNNDYKRNLLTTLIPFTDGSDNPTKILDNDVNSYTQSDLAEDYDVVKSVGLLFDDFYKLSELEVTIPSDLDYFPSNISVDYTTDGGKTFESLPKYYFLYKYSIGRFTPIMRFPNPKGATLKFNLDGIVANGIRLSSRQFLNDDRTISVSEMRVYGDLESTFYTSFGKTFDADLNNMWSIFGTAQTEPVVSGSLGGEKTNQSPFRSGFAMIASTEWAEWTGMKFNWTDYNRTKNIYLNQLINIRYGNDGWSSDDGYIYATSESPKHLEDARHYTYNPIYINAVRNYLLQGNNLNIEQDGEVVSFLDAKNSHGQSIINKVEKAMSYMLNTLDGKNGILTIYDPENNGTQTGKASNYWDAMKAFGYKSAYENALFYASLNSMADIMYYLNDSVRAEYYLSIAALCKSEYNKLFFDEEKGRYITSVNSKGELLDFGVTYVNFYAIYYGLASVKQAKVIYDWLDGRRIIEGDTSTGDDIYGGFIYAPRGNTLDISSTGAPYYWWDHGGQLPPTPGTFGGFDHQMQNGGTIFYISHYDVASRINGYGVDDAFNRFNTILTEFHKDSLRRNSYRSFVQNGNQGIGEYREGVMGEFPESGLVPLTFLTSFLGINPSFQGLLIKASLPTNMTYAGVRNYHYGNRVYSIQISKEISEPIMEFDGTKYFVKLPYGTDYCITLDNRLTRV